MAQRKKSVKHGKSDLLTVPKILFIFKKKILGSLSKGKPENPLNIAKNQEFEMITSRHFKNLISPKPVWNSQWSLISLQNLR